MNKKEALITYLLNVKAKMEAEKRRIVTLTEFADFVDLPLRTVTSMFDPEDARLPIEANAAKIAIALYSNQIMEILGYNKIDPIFLQLKKYYDQLPEDDQVEILTEIQTRVKGNAAQPVMAT